MADQKTVPEDREMFLVLESIGNSESGKKLLVWLIKRCGYNRSVLRVSRASDDIAPLSTEARAAERDVYGDLRLMMTPEMRHAIELLSEKATPAPVVKPKEEERKK